MSDSTHNLQKKNYTESVINDIATRSEEGRGKKGIDWQSFKVTFILIVMIAIAVIQTFELLNIYNKINSGNIKSFGNSSSDSSGGLENLPNMVGGC